MGEQNETSVHTCPAIQKTGPLIFNRLLSNGDTVARIFGESLTGAWKGAPGPAFLSGK